MTTLLELPDFLIRRRQCDLWSDFTHYVAGDDFNDVDADVGSSVAIDADGHRGRMLLTTGATDNNEVYLFSTQELFLFAQDKPFRTEVRLQYAEANTDDANVAFGLMNAVGADSILDDGGGPKADYSGCVVFKEDGQTLWSCESSQSTTQTTTQSQSTAGGSSFHTIAIEGYTVQGDLWITYHIDTAGGQNLKQMRDSNGNPIKHKITLSSPTEMQVFVGAKAGGANSEVVTVDYLGCSQLR